MSGRLRVGVVGAGPWAQLVHAPMLAGHSGTTLAGVWARRPEAATEVAAANDAPAFDDYDALLDACDAVAFAVPPDVQSDLAVRAARAGKTLLLEKPLALDVDAARRLVDAVDDAGVGSQLVLSWRYAAAVRSFLDAVAASEPIGGRGHFLSGAALGGLFATPWRLEHGPLLDLGPHVVDTLDAALGPVVDVRARGDSRRWVGLLLEHEGGLSSEVSLSMRTSVEPMRAGAEVYTETGAFEVDAAASVGPDAIATVVDELIATAAGTPHPLDVHRGLHLQQVLDAARRDLAGRR